MKIEIKYPFICFNIIQIDVDDDKAEEILNDCQENQAQFIIDNIPVDDYLMVPNGKKGIVSALDTDIYAHIKEVKP
ncbi:hypothetical protein LIV57_06770 [Chryseobacterium sp. X308]|uniref:hypothetical protein n=1 Tax=Chryseobacterium sp. X308 TaxID=2884873 RepID=UPI001D13C5C4|nr:hypothetical protein [Chryseobacterium sp. X308]MCC3214970.1 hypothetical protein [Chryseobacterium sp. X308]